MTDRQPQPQIQAQTQARPPLPPAPRPAIVRSVFVKLVAVMLLMALSLFAIVSVFFALVVGPNLHISLDVIDAFAQAFAKSAPDFQAAKQLTTRFDVQVRYEGPDGAWTTSDRVPTIAEIRRRLTPGHSHAAKGWRDYYLADAPNGGTYLFAWDVRLSWESAHVTLLWMMLLLVVFVVVAAHGALRWILWPLRPLSDGVARLSAGDLDIALPTRTRDEFGLLTNAFNEMVRRVRAMIHARDQLLLDVSHELRSPITRMKVALALMPEDDRRACMEADLVEMEMMIAELLEIERLRDGHGLRIARQDLMPIVREMVERVGDRPPGVHLVPGPRELLLDIDADKMRTVLRNLLDNAIKYSLPDSRAVTVSVAERDGTVVIRVDDDGVGVPEGDAANLFEPFFRVDRSRSKKTGGYGLGLSICKRILEAHGGRIAVESRPADSISGGRGASFVLTLPARYSEPSARPTDTDRSSP
jgi:signal transduction histidine kinase